MSLANYSDLVSAIGAWLDRDDLAERAPDFIRLAEARMNRLLDDPEMEISFTGTPVDGALVLPADYGEMVSLTAGRGRLSAVGPDQFTDFISQPGEPRYYSISGRTMRFAPVGAGPVTMVYRRRIPSLTADSATNWLMSLAPDAYLYGSLVQASAYLAEDDRVMAWKAVFEEAIAELRVDAARRKWGAGPIAPRINRA